MSEHLTEVCICQSGRMTPDGWQRGWLVWLPGCNYETPVYATREEALRAIATERCLDLARCRVTDMPF